MSCVTRPMMLQMGFQGREQDGGLENEEVHSPVQVPETHPAAISPNLVDAQVRRVPHYNTASRAAVRDANPVTHWRTQHTTATEVASRTPARPKP